MAGEENNNPVDNAVEQNKGESLAETTQNTETVTDLTNTAPVPSDSAARTSPEELVPPVKPPRPLSPFAQAHLALTEAFPTIESNVVRAVLIGAEGKMDAAFNGLLSLTDPSYVVDESLFSGANTRSSGQAPLRSGRNAKSRTQPRSQIEEDEQLARMLADEERGSGRRTDASRQSRSHGRTSASGPSNNEEDRSFFDDDLPQIKADFAKGFTETKDKVNNWFDNFRKKMDSPEPILGGFLGGSNNANRGAHNSQGAQRGDASRRQRYYDGEPDEIDFKGIKLTDNDADDRPPMPPRPTEGGAKTGDEDDLYTSPQGGLPSKAKVSNNGDKKIPLKSSTLSGTAAEDDPFLISDSDEEAASPKKELEKK